MPLPRLLALLGAASLLAACGAPPQAEAPAPPPASPTAAAAMDPPRCPRLPEPSERLVPVLLDALAPTTADSTAQPPLTVRAEWLVERDTVHCLSARIAYPQVEGDERPALARINRAIEDFVRSFVEDVRPAPDSFTGDPEMDEWIVGVVEGAYPAVLLQDGLFSTRLDLYFYTGGAHGNSVGLPFNYDLDTGAEIRLGDLFRPSAAYLDTLAARATQRLHETRGTGWMFEEAVPAEAGLFTVFTLEADSLRLFFPPYAIAPYSAGPSEAALAYEALRPILRADGPVARLAR